MPKVSDYKSFRQFYEAFQAWERKKYGQTYKSNGTGVLVNTT
jgi:hypothetical protein